MWKNKTEKIRRATATRTEPWGREPPALNDRGARSRELHGQPALQRQFHKIKICSSGTSLIRSRILAFTQAGKMPAGFKFGMKKIFEITQQQISVFILFHGTFFLGRKTLERETSWGRKRILLNASIPLEKGEKQEEGTKPQLPNSERTTSCGALSSGISVAHRCNPPPLLHWSPESSVSWAISERKTGKLRHKIFLLH